MSNGCIQKHFYFTIIYFYFINIFPWFASGLVLQPVTFRIHPPETTIGNGFPILTTSNCFLCYHQDCKSVSVYHFETSSLLNPFHHFLLIIIILSKIGKKWFHCCKDLPMKTSLIQLVTKSILTYFIDLHVQNDSTLFMSVQLTFSAD